jgi:hypothetical protein
MKLGRILGTALLGLLLFLFVAVDLVIFGVVALDSIVVTVLPILGLIVGGVLGGMASQRRGASNNVAPLP